jgi:uncharacterized protein
MRVVIDTNVFVSGVFWKGAPGAVLDAWRDGRIQVVLSPAILAEYERVGAELRRQYPTVDLREIMRLLTVNSRTVKDVPLPKPACSDPDDDKFLAVAVAGRAEYVVSGDKALLNVREYRGVRIISPGAFVRTSLPKK